jgi:hypothetical protein
MACPGGEGENAAEEALAELGLLVIMGRAGSSEQDDDFGGGEGDKTGEVNGCCPGSLKPRRGASERIADMCGWLFRDDVRGGSAWSGCEGDDSSADLGVGCVGTGGGSTESEKVEFVPWCDLCTGESAELLQSSPPSLPRGGEFCCLEMGCREAV